MTIKQFLDMFENYGNAWRFIVYGGVYTADQMRDSAMLNDVIKSFDIANQYAGERNVVLLEV